MHITTDFPTKEAIMIHLKNPGKWDQYQLRICVPTTHTIFAI